ncbi:MAG: CPBP family intramembrane metalloprotease [Ignavibacteriales bacterium]|nr:CPBP family intramembrane metalloprotease [Ignavibacteriales bacterium]
MNAHPTTGAVQKTMTLLGVILFCYLVNMYSQIFFISNHLTFVDLPSRSGTFERHFWQFVFGFLAIGFLSRGHLWSYGINSQNLKSSMQWLVWLYIGVMLLTVIVRLFDTDLLPMNRSEMPRSARDTIMAILIYWMSSPVANQILFFGFGQTILMKQFGDTAKIAGVPLVVLISAVLFSLFGVDSAFLIGRLSIMTTFAIGLFSGVVYWKTNSLITPMLGHAFVLGFPLVVELLSLTFAP